MKTRDNMSAVIDGLQSQHGLLAAYLEATDNRKRVLTAETPKQVSAAPEVTPSASTFVFRRANLVRVNPERRSLGHTFVGRREAAPSTPGVSATSLLLFNRYSSCGFLLRRRFRWHCTSQF